MKITAKTLMLASAGTCTAQLSLLADYTTLFNHCQTAGPNTYVAVFYSNSSSIVTFDYNQCYPYQLDYPTGPVARMAVFCKTVTCYNNPNPDCTGGAVPPVPVLIPQYLTLANVGDWVQLLGQGATCQKNGLS